MVRTQSRNDDEPADETTLVDVRTTDVEDYEDGETVRVHYRDADDEPSKCVTGAIECKYSDARALIVTDDDRRLIVDLSDTAADGGLRDFDTDETIGRPMFAETAYHPEKDGEDLRDDLLEDDDATDDRDDEDDHDGDTPACPACDSDDVKSGAAANPGDVRDFGCRECGTAWNVGDVDVLVYEHTRTGAHEKTGESWSKVETKRVKGTRNGSTFNSFDGGHFRVEDGVAYYEPSPEARRVDSEYEVGTNARFE